MQRRFLLLAAVSITSSAMAADFGGQYVGETESSLILTLQESSDGRITGTLADAGVSMPLSARRQGAGFAGTVGPAGQALACAASLQSDRLILEVGAPGASERFAFRRADGARSSAAPPVATGQRNVVINGKRLSDDELGRAERTYRIRIPDADYWYDRVLGAWGVQGSPTLGFIAAGLDLGGPLRADASGGGTGVFVNGRALHPYDLMALQQITGSIAAGRYFITAQGIAGYEGGPPQWNIATLVAAAQGGGGSNTWQSRITGGSGFSDGTTSAVFLPNGGIVSTGQ